MVRLFNFFSKINYNNFYKKFFLFFYLFIYKDLILYGKIYNSLNKTKNLMD
jgi:hypothetical protein